MRSLWALLGLLLCAALGFAAAAAVVLTRGLPQVAALEQFVPPSSSRILAADGSLLAEFATERRTPVPLGSIPPLLARCVLAIEDHRFYQHVGLNPGRIAKALVTDLLAGGFVEGASTITQQLAKVLFLTAEKTVGRKLREALLALEIERRYTKEEILGFYLNQIYLGNGAYGVEAAARVYFGQSVAQLSLDQCALLATLPKAPSRYDPFSHPERAKARRDLVLARVLELGWAEPEAVAAARAQPLPVAAPAAPPVRAPYFVERVRRLLIEALGSDLLYQGGLRVYTTLDPALQQASEAALERGLEAVQRRHPRRPVPQGAALALDVQTGAVRAQVGGRDWQESHFDRALQARRQPGSGYKFFPYLAALEEGYSQAHIVSDAEARFRGASPSQPWRPQNYDGTFEGEMTLRRALAHSRNLPAIQLMQTLGTQRVEATARRLGLAGPFGEGLASALGVGGATLLEMVRAYAAVAGGGLLPEPHWIRAVYGPDGRNLWPRPPVPRRVLEPVTAYVMADLLRAVVEEGTGKKARALPFPVAGKTGTTDDQRDAWFVGFSSRLAAGTWVGYDDNSPLGWGETGAQAALPVWIDLLLAAAAKGPPPPWPVPAGVEFTDMDVKTGLRSGPACEETAYAAFARGRAPRRDCDSEAFSLGDLGSRLRLDPGAPSGGAPTGAWEDRSL